MYKMVGIKWGKNLLDVNSKFPSYKHYIISITDIVYHFVEFKMFSALHELSLLFT